MKGKAEYLSVKSIRSTYFVTFSHCSRYILGEQRHHGGWRWSGVLSIKVIHRTLGSRVSIVAPRQSSIITITIAATALWDWCRYANSSLLSSSPAPPPTQIQWTITSYPSARLLSAFHTSSCLSSSFLPRAQSKCCHTVLSYSSLWPLNSSLQLGVLESFSSKFKYRVWKFPYSVSFRRYFVRYKNHLTTCARLVVTMIAINRFRSSTLTLAKQSHTCAQRLLITLV